MFEVLLLLLICSLLGYGIQNSRQSSPNDEGAGFSQLDQRGKCLYAFLMLMLVWFAGLRTVMNDTAIYMLSFTVKTPGTLSELTSIDWAIGANPLFNLYCALLKILVSKNAQILVFVTSLIVVVSMLMFLLKYSINFAFSLYIFIAFCAFAFTMAAMKQTLATAIAIWAIPLIDQKKWNIALVLLVFAALIHPYVILLGCAFFFQGKSLWSKYDYLVILGTVLIGIFWTMIMHQVIDVTNSIGEEYQESYFAAETGVALPRILFYLFPSILAFLARKDLQSKCPSLWKTFIHLSVVASCFSLMSGKGGAVFIGRIPNYFDIFVCLTVPYLISQWHSSSLHFRRTMSVIIICLYLGYYVTYYKKYYNFLPQRTLFTSFYERVSLFDFVSSL